MCGRIASTRHESERTSSRSLMREGGGQDLYRKKKRGGETERNKPNLMNITHHRLVQLVFVWGVTSLVVLMVCFVWNATCNGSFHFFSLGNEVHRR